MDNTNTNFDVLSTLLEEKLDNNFNDVLDNNLENNDITINNIQKDDILAILTEDINISQNLNEINNEIQEDEIVKEKSFIWNTINNIIFFIKYIATSSIIFVVILILTNYSAYIEIAKSYFNPNILEQNKNSLTASINSASINSETITIQENKNNMEEEEKNIKMQVADIQKIDMVKNKTYHSMDKLKTKTEKNINIDIEITPYENRIIIPKLWKNIPLVEVENKKVKDVKELEKVFMDELVKWIIRYPGSAKPWEKWNSFIFWHSSNFPWMKWDYNDVFALLDNVVFDDEIIVYYEQKKYIYKVREKQIIKPWNVSILKRNKWKKEISLMTCWPIWTTLNRMIVIWELQEVKK